MVRRRLALVCFPAVLAAGAWGVKLVQLHRSVDAYDRFWSEPRGAAGGLTYVALGDSAAQAIGASRPERGYVGLLADRLRERSGRPVLVHNLSRSGARIDDVVRTQLPRLRELSPDVVTVAVGGNDVRAFDLTTFEQQVQRLTDALPPGSFVADVPYFGHGSRGRDAQRAADLVRAHAGAAGHVPVLLHEALRDEGWRAALTQFAADWFHPNDRGYRVWADAFWQHLQHAPVVQPP